MATEEQKQYVTNYGRWWFGNVRFREIPSEPPPPFAYTPSRNYTLQLFDSEGIRQAVISSEYQKATLKELTFELLETGCGAFSFSLLEPFTQYTIGYNQRVDIHLFGDETPWFSGYVTELPVAGSTEKLQVYRGFGYFGQLESCIVDKEYQNIELAGIVHDLMTQFIEPKTDIIYDPTKITATGFTVTDINFDKVTAKKALTDLAEMAQDYLFGVDSARALFFRPVDTTVKIWRHVGKHLSRFSPKEDISKIVNRIYVKAGKITSKSNYIATVEDVASQAAYGLREAVMTVPTSLNATDATRWGNYQLSKLKDPVESAKVANVELDNTKIEPPGKASIRPLSGSAVELYIKRAAYKVSAGGITCDLDLGEVDMPVEAEILNLLRDIKNEELLQSANVKQLAP